MPKARKPTPPPKKQTPMEKMIAECVKNAKARKASGQTDREWREQYAGTLKTEGAPVRLSETPFEGDTKKKI